MDGNTIEIRVLGPVRVTRGGHDVELPKSRKVRVLLAILALEPAAVSRSRLCDLLWDAPNDPKGELRWCLSKLRGVLDDDSHQRVVTHGHATVELDVSDCVVDAIEIQRVVTAGVETASIERLTQVAQLIGGELLDGIAVDGAELTAWVAAQRQRCLAQCITILREVAVRAARGSDEMFRGLEALLQRAPFDQRGHEIMIDALVAAGRLRDAEEYVSRTIRMFEDEARDWTPLRAALQAARGSVVVVPSPVDKQPPVRRGSIVVMPFVASTADASDVANGLTDDIITRLAKLRALFVIARGTSYSLRERGIDAREAGRILDVDYAVSGVVRRGARLDVIVELVETASGMIVWADEITVGADEALSVLDSIIDRIVSTVAEEIERAESKRAIIKPPSSLDAWEAYHRGLWHMYRFTGVDNEHATRFFRDALQLDPGFARAYAGLSFTHFQNVFLGLAPDRDQQLALTLATAEQSVAADDRDPAAHWALGRALWLGGDQRSSISELEHSIELSPNFALGHYTLGFVHAQSGDPHIAVSATEQSRLLSPFDPLQFAMLASRALANMRLGEHDAAAEWAVKAANRPNAHVHILAIAATNLALAGRRDQAREVVGRIRGRSPAYRLEHFLRAFRLATDAEQLIRRGASDIGFD